MQNVELQKKYQLFIGGQWKDASDGKTFQSICPADGRVLTECAEATKEDVVMRSGKLGKLLRHGSMCR